MNLNLKFKKISLIVILFIFFKLDQNHSEIVTFDHTTLQIGTNTIHVEVAKNDMTRTCGLMFRTKINRNEGMLFIFPKPRQVAFWMKNTSIPLSIAYISCSGKILEMHDLEPYNEKPIVSFFCNIMYALEMNRGWFTQHDILPGDSILLKHN